MSVQSDLVAESHVTLEGAQAVVVLTEPFGDIDYPIDTRPVDPEFARWLSQLR